MTHERLNNLDLFRSNVVGKKYGLKAKNLLFSSKSEKDLNYPAPEHEIAKDRQFFCSELIAKTFKVLDLFKDPDQKGSSNYMPTDFAPANQGGSGVVDQELKDDVAMGGVLNIMVNA